LRKKGEHHFYKEEEKIEVLGKAVKKPRMEKYI